MEGLKRPSGTDIDMEHTCLDIMKEELLRFGAHIEPAHKDMLAVLTPRLEARLEATRKRATATIGALVSVMSDASFQSLMELVIARIAQIGGKEALLFTYIQCIGVISQSAGARIGKYLERIVPRLERFCVPEQQQQQLGSGEHEQLVELWENCLQAFESIITRCPNEVTPYVPAMVRISLEFIQYDPNYTYADDDDDDDAMEDEDDGFGGGDDDGFGEGGGDGGDEWGEDDGWAQGGGNDLDDENVGDDDSSWKVRRAAVRTLAAFIRCRADLLQQHFQQVCDALVARFKERDQPVKLAVLAAAVELIESTAVLKQDLSQRTGQLPQVVHTRPFHAAMLQQTGAIIAVTRKQLSKAKSVKPETRQAVLEIFRALLVVIRGFGGHLAVVLPVIQNALAEDHTQLKTEALCLLRLIVDNHAPEVLGDYVSVLAEAAMEHVQNHYLKIKAEAMRLMGSLVRVLNDTHRGLAVELYAALYGQLLLKDMDMEAKEASITSMAVLIARFGDAVQGKLQECLPVLGQRLQNEVTRMPALRALATIARSPLRIDLSLILQPSLEQLCTFLRKESQSLRHETALTLNALMGSGVRCQVQPVLLEKLLSEVAPLVSDADLHLSHLLLELVASVLEANSSVGVVQVARTQVMPAARRFLASPLLQGSALKSVVRFYQATVLCCSTDLAVLVEDLLALVNEQLGLSSCLAVAQCVAAMVKAVGTAEADQMVNRCTADVKANNPDHKKQIALLILGEIGREKDLGNHQDVEGVTFSAFSVDSDRVRNAASYTLGNIAVGNMQKYLPLVLEMVTSHKSQAYLLLSSLKEIISRHSMDANSMHSFLPYVPAVTPILFANAESPEEGVRGMVAECLGGVAIIDPEHTLPGMLERVSSPNPHMRAVVATAVRYSLAAHSDVRHLKEALPRFFQLLHDADLTVRRQSLRTVNGLAHMQPEILQDVLEDTVQPVLYEYTKPNPALVRIVDLGPFKQKVDDGLPLRKLAFQALDTLLQSSPHLFDVGAFINHIKAGLADHDDVQILTYGIFANLAEHHGNALLAVLDELPDLVFTGVRVKLKEAKKAEPERALDVLRATVRALHAMHSLPGAQTATAFADFYLRVLKTPLLAKMLEQMQSGQ